MTATERTQIWQQRIKDWQTTDLSGSDYCKQRVNFIVLFRARNSR